MGVYVDPAVTGAGELPAEEEIAATVVGQLLPLLRNALARLNAMQLTWHVNGIPAKVEAAATAQEPLAGYDAATWVAWGTVLTELQVWLETPIESLNATPAQILITRYPRAQ